MTKGITGEVERMTGYLEVKSGIGVGAVRATIQSQRNSIRRLHVRSQLAPEPVGVNERGGAREACTANRGWREAGLCREATRTLVPDLARAVVNGYLRLGDVKGEGTDQDHEDWIIIESMKGQYLFP